MKLRSFLVIKHTHSFLVVFSHYEFKLLYASKNPIFSHLYSKSDFNFNTFSISFFQVSFVFQSRCTYRSVSIVYKSINLQRTNQFGAKFMFSHLQFHKLFVCHLWFHRFHFVVIEPNIWYLPQTMIAHMYPPLRVTKTIPSLKPNATSTVCCQPVLELKLPCVCS